MSALSILYLVLPFPLLFILHDAEEVMVQHRWMQAHRESLVSRFPKMRPMLMHLSNLSTKAFAIAAFEELVILLVVTCHVLADGAYAMQLWSALFMAFSIHLLVHIAQAVIVRGYVPGLATSLILLPYAAYGIYSIRLSMSGAELMAWGALGILIMVVNLRFAHWIGLKICGK
ncbi:MAG: HXXEE domain-containing protein [Prevotella sp.]